MFFFSLFQTMVMRKQGVYKQTVEVWNTFGHLSETLYLVSKTSTYLVGITLSLRYNHETIIIRVVFQKFDLILW